jgi:hypothetical protein
MCRVAFALMGLGLALVSGAAEAGPYTPAAYGFAGNTLSGMTVTAAARRSPLGGFGVGGLGHDASLDASLDVALFGAGAPGGGTSAGLLSRGVDIGQATSGPGPFPSENDFQAMPGSALGMIGARADADIRAGSPFVGGGVTESVTAEGALPSGAAERTESLAIDWTEITFSLIAPTALSLSFKDDVALAAATAAGASAAARAGTVTEVAIYDGSGHKVFGFTPDGSGPGAILGGTATADPFNLQSAIASTMGSGAVRAGNSGATDQYAAITNVLPVGDYTLEFGTGAYQRLVDAPEPATIGVLGAGLAAIGLVRRRRA